MSVRVHAPLGIFIFLLFPSPTFYFLFSPLYLLYSLPSFSSLLSPSFFPPFYFLSLSLFSLSLSSFIFQVLAWSNRTCWHCTSGSTASYGKQTSPPCTAIIISHHHLASKEQCIHTCTHMHKHTVTHTHTTLTRHSHDTHTTLTNTHTQANTQLF